MRTYAHSLGTRPELGAPAEPHVARRRKGLSPPTPRIPSGEQKHLRALLRAPGQDAPASPDRLSKELIGNRTSGTMASSDVKPKSISRAKKWSEEIENLYRFQQAGYRDEIEYKQVKQVSMVDRWPETGYVKKLQRRDNTFYYYNKQRECDDKEVHRVKIYAY